MNEEIKKKYDELYSKENNVFGVGKPLPILEKAIKFASPGKALDIGAGEGRNSIFLAQNEFEVKAIDTSEVAIDKLKKSADKLNLNIDAKVSDITEYDLSENYDLVLISFSLHHLSSKEGEELINKIKEKTNAGGLNVITAFTKEGDFYKLTGNDKKFYPDLGELKELYKDWEIVSFSEKETTAHQKTEKGEDMKNLTSFLIAKK